MIPSHPYPTPHPASHGHWAPVTSTLDWCEENYYLTPYIAEPVNTVTNLMIITLSIRGLHNTITQSHDSVFLYAWLASLMIGVGSLLFHATLLFPMQIVDEISMIYTSAILIYAVFEPGRSAVEKWGIGMGVGAVTLAGSVYYCYLDNPVVHQVAFVVMTALGLGRGVYLMEKTLRPEWKVVEMAVQGRPERWMNEHGGVVRAEGDRREREKRDRGDLEVLRGMYRLMGFGLGCALLGFAIWTGDRVFCQTLRRWRRMVGLPWGILLEGHGWWHLLTGVAAHNNIVWNIWMRYGLYGRQDEIEVIWPSLFFSVPQVVKKEKLKKR